MGAEGVHTKFVYLIQEQNENLYLRWFWLATPGGIDLKAINQWLPYLILVPLRNQWQLHHEKLLRGKSKYVEPNLVPHEENQYLLCRCILHRMHSMRPVKNAGKLKYASFARSSNPFRGRVLFTIHRWTQIVHLVQNWTRPSVTFAKSKVSSSLAKCWEWSQNLSQVCKWHSWEANCKDFLLRAQTYTFILLPRAEQSRLSDPALCLIPAVVDLLPKSANQLGQEIGNQAEIGTFEQEICMYQ